MSRPESQAHRPTEVLVKAADYIIFLRGFPGREADERICHMRAEDARKVAVEYYANSQVAK